MEKDNLFIENFKAMLKETALNFEVDLENENYIEAIRIIEGKNNLNDIDSEAL